MAKSKNEAAISAEPNNVPALEAEVSALTGLVQKYEDLLAELQPELWRFRRMLLANDAHRQAATSAGDLYQKVRGALGDRGEQLDAVLRGVK
jgi:hypothetical protein